MTTLLPGVSVSTGRGLGGERVIRIDLALVGEAKRAALVLPVELVRGTIVPLLIEQDDRRWRALGALLLRQCGLINDPSAHLRVVK
jgi:hypothetical protein